MEGIMFETLTAQIEANNTKRLEELLFFVRNGHRPDSKEKLTDEGIERYSTDARWKAYKNGKLGREKAIELAYSRAVKKERIELEKPLRKIRAATAALDLTYVKIQVEWHHSSMWGSNSHAEVWTDGGGLFEGRTSGCGYDKLSASVASALNHSPSVLKALYIGKVNGIKFPYGAGHNMVLPYFEGGVGIECFGHIFEALGYKWECTGSGKTFDCYQVSK
jgi:hypothetical protein